jgi:hypothetical protein
MIVLICRGGNEFEPYHPIGAGIQVNINKDVASKHKV